MGYSFLKLVSFDESSIGAISQRTQMVFDYIAKHNLPLVPVTNDSVVGFLGDTVTILQVLHGPIEFAEFVSLLQGSVVTSPTFEDIYDWPYNEEINDLTRFVMARCFDKVRAMDILEADEDELHRIWNTPAYKERTDELVEVYQNTEIMIENRDFGSWVVVKRADRLDNAASTFPTFMIEKSQQPKANYYTLRGFSQTLLENYNTPTWGSWLEGLDAVVANPPFWQAINGAHSTVAELEDIDAIQWNQETADYQTFKMENFGKVKNGTMTESEFKETLHVYMKDIFAKHQANYGYQPVEFPLVPNWK